jgi:hypothetical protein
LRNYYNNYDEVARDVAGECHAAGCCIDCFNGAINELHGITEAELTSTSTAHPQRIDYTLGILQAQGLAESVGSFTPTRDGSGKITGFDNQEIQNALIDATGGARGVYFYGVSIGNG